MDPFLVLHVISGALAVRGSNLRELVREALAAPGLPSGGSEDEAELKGVLDQLERQELIATRKVGEDPIYSITARGVVAAERERAKKPLFGSLFGSLL